MNRAEKTVERFKYIGQGENLAEKIDLLPEDLKISKFYSRGSTMRLDGNKPSPTIVPGHSNFPIHPTEHRCITVGKLQPLQDFLQIINFLEVTQKGVNKLEMLYPQI